MPPIDQVTRAKIRATRPSRNSPLEMAPIDQVTRAAAVEAARIGLMVITYVLKGCDLEEDVCIVPQSDRLLEVTGRVWNYAVAGEDAYPSIEDYFDSKGDGYRFSAFSDLVQPAYKNLLASSDRSDWDFLLGDLGIDDAEIDEATSMGVSTSTLKTLERILDARLDLEEGILGVAKGSDAYITIPKIALLAGMKEESVRNVAHPDRPGSLRTTKKGRDTLVHVTDARQWLEKRGFQLSRRFRSQPNEGDRK